MNRFALIVTLATLAVGCDGKPTAPAHTPVADHRGEAAGGEEGHGHGHAHGGEVVSDLDRPVEQLFAARCEHQLPTFECGECRYEVGVAHPAASLLEEGLIRTLKVARRPLDSFVGLTGEIGFDEKRISHVSSQVEGVIGKVHVSLGATVRRGDPLLEIQSVAFGEAEGEYRAAQASLSLAERDHERQQKLRAEGISADKELLQAVQALETARIRLQTAANRLVRLGLPASELEAVREGRGAAKLVLRASAPGTVLSLHAVPGEVARSEESLLTVGDLSRLWLWADLYEADQAGVAERQAKSRLAAQISVAAFPGREFRGEVDFLGPTMDPATRTVKVRVLVDNPEGLLRAGMFAKARLFVPTATQAIAVPRVALLQDEGRSFVFVRHHGEYFVRRPVIAGRTLGDWVEIVQGLEEGQELATEGAFLLKSDVLRSKMGAGCAD
jgi:cobalt-zinc-cadmium efflux system membrane fusion protein